MVSPLAASRRPLAIRSLPHPTAEPGTERGPRFENGISIYKPILSCYYCVRVLSCRLFMTFILIDQVWLGRRSWQQWEPRSRP